VEPPGLCTLAPNYSHGAIARSVVSGLPAIRRSQAN
jgi:hypothetical protein